MRTSTKHHGLTAARLRQVLAYDPISGQFRWRVRMNPRGPDHTGKLAGCPNNGGYLTVRIDGRLYLAHLLAWLYMKGEWPSAEIDHVDTIHNHNHWENLRPASSAQNKMNARLRLDNALGLKGVSDSFESKYKKRPYRARIQFGRKQIFIGRFATPTEAHAAYVAKANELFGAFSNPG